MSLDQAISQSHHSPQLSSAAYLGNLANRFVRFLSVDLDFVRQNVGQWMVADSSIRHA